jgi:hypothetical protein
MDVAEEGRDVVNPQASAAWIDAVVQSIHRGSAWNVEPAFLNDLLAAFGCQQSTEFQKEPMASALALSWLIDLLERRRGRCWRWMVGGEGMARPTWCC